MDEEYQEVFELTAEESRQEGGEEEPAPQGDGESNGAFEGGETAEDGGGGEALQGDAEEGAREADIRRAAEQGRIDRVYAELFSGQQNPFTGTVIQSEADYLAYQQENQRRQRLQEQQQMERQLEEAGLEPEALRQLVSREVESHPAVLQAQAATLAAARERAALVQRQAESAIAKSLESISAEFPEIKQLEDIAALPTAGRFQDLVRQGLPLEDAFFLANRQEIARRERESSRQAAINAARGKGHLNAGVGMAAGGEAVEVPSEMVDSYRTLMPGATDAEIRVAYGKYLKELK